jgi:predicted Zn finger-like uncharacterized protein
MVKDSLSAGPWAGYHEPTQQRSCQWTLSRERLMAVVQFACPYCSGQFDVENPPAGQAVRCPHCEASVVLPGEPPAVDAPPPANADPLAFLTPPAAGPAPTFAPDEPMPVVREVRKRKPRPAPREVRHLSREEKERRRAVRNLVLMTAGVVILCVAAILLSRL